MGIVGTKLNIDFVISTGDNFYEKGLMGPDDTQFTTSFSDVYTQESLQTPWYSGALNYPTVLHTHAGKVVQDECSILSDLMWDLEMVTLDALLRTHKNLCEWTLWICPQFWGIMTIAAMWQHKLQRNSQFVTPAGSAVPPTNLFVISASQIKVILGSLLSLIQSFLFSGPHISGDTSVTHVKSLRLG